ncbi:merR regulatory family protein [Clostridioides difficile P48]|uniref:MerR family transcriptional regulator n=1 Tax=Clostridioides difficile TaxID=1496 RepID=UPI00038D4286|nr:MerR family DNA-binding transcriptional regulator [Clostridioides difficile]EQJ77613.1 merR regulatory family protein [Clostridioides difficile P48]
MYTIGQVSKFLGISRDTLKFYEDKGLEILRKMMKMDIEYIIRLISMILQQ